MSEQINKEEQNENVFESSEIMILCRVWLKFLKDAGNYASRVYLLDDLNRENSNPDSQAVLWRYYCGSIRTVKLVIQDDIDRMEESILKIREQQLRMKIGTFPVDGDSLQTFIDAFSLQGCFGATRREFYRRKVRGMMKHTDRKPLNLHELEAAFKASKAYANALQKASS